jgi:hypothetical protein
VLKDSFFVDTPCVSSAFWGWQNCYAALGVGRSACSSQTSCPIEWALEFRGGIDPRQDVCTCKKDVWLCTLVFIQCLSTWEVILRNISKKYKFSDSSHICHQLSHEAKQSTYGSHYRILHQGYVVAMVVRGECTNKTHLPNTARHLTVPSISQQNEHPEAHHSSSKPRAR